ncbi:sulfotransferase family protein [Marinobacterium nitratireducens]|uniref:Sulfotransferase family protein n=1 Tax=Marinobacterium nitratireducens TaxID=518897 RepID=A0A917ZCT3_9GAMM|nr:sulfotransferase family protein [Marinobacterium nitratireducens]GGO80973.1 sulfotransferase family protein [Marinobacterium nitratireducens]
MTLKVIGAGFGRTGTMSMKAALEQLGLGPCYHMVECLPRGPEHWQKWTDAAKGHPDWDSIFDGFASTVDFPASTSYKALADYYPDAKVVLTVRDPERWFESTQETIFAPHWIEYLRTVEMGEFIQATINDYLQDRMHDKEHLIRRFNEHIAEVRASIPASRLLVFEVKDGWGPLCEFLEMPVPDTDFPQVNDTEATKGIINKIIENGAEAVFGYSG